MALREMMARTELMRRSICTFSRVIRDEIYRLLGEPELFDLHEMRVGYDKHLWVRGRPTTNLLLLAGGRTSTFACVKRPALI